MSKSTDPTAFWFKRVNFGKMRKKRHMEQNIEPRLHESIREVRHTRYVFVDVIQFTERDALDQFEIVAALDQIVRSAVQEIEDGVTDKSTRKRFYFLPTGDGLCVALPTECWPPSYPVHLRIAEAILRHLGKYNLSSVPFDQKFKLHIGIGEGEDLYRKDINFCGKGINDTARAMAQSKGRIVMTESAKVAMEEKATALSFKAEKCSPSFFTFIRFDKNH
jgi:hypothetical protein